MAETELLPCIADAWQELLDKDDRTSPEEYPEMALITRDELAEFMARASLSIERGDSEVLSSGWLPIESAPKDGTEILVRRVDGAARIAIFYRNYWYSIPGRYALEVNGWMPLPSPPALKQEGASEGEERLSDRVLKSDEQ